MANKFLLLNSLLPLLILILQNQHNASAVRTDLTIVAGSNGTEVVDATFRKLRRAQVFADDFDFIKRLAYVESLDGNSDQLPNDGGIWQVNEDYLVQSKLPSLENLHQNISKAFNINWTDVTYSDLKKPLYSAIAARLYLVSVGKDIPQSIDTQADYWLQHYNQRDSTKETWPTLVEEMENKTANCDGKMEFVLVLDGSGSVGAENFVKAKGFVVSLIESFSLITSRFGYLVYSSAVDTLFKLDNTLTIDQIRKLINDYVYVGGGTDTNRAIKDAVDMFANVAPRPGIPKVLAILTDGASGTGVGNIELARQAKINTFAVGIGDSVNQQELLQIALGDVNHLFSLNDFDALQEFYRRLKSETCAIAHNPGFGVVTEDTLGANEKRFYVYDVPTNGVTISIKLVQGATNAYYSSEDENPSSAFNDGVIVGSSVIPDNSQGTKVYVTVHGLQTVNSYTISVVNGTP